LDRSVEVRFTYDLSGLLEVDATVQATGKTRSVLVTRNCAEGMSEADIAKARAELQKLKIKPAEELPNAALLARADLRYQESKGRTRDELGRAIAWFLAVIEEGEPESIRAARESLEALLADSPR